MILIGRGLDLQKNEELGMRNEELGSESGPRRHNSDEESFEKVCERMRGRTEVVLVGQRKGNQPVRF